MKRIVLALNPLQQDVRIMDFACYLARLTKSTLIGLFLEKADYPAIPTRKQVFGVPLIETIVEKDLPDYEENERILNESIKRFKNACEYRDVQCEMIYDIGNPIESINAESRFADIIVIDPKTSFDSRVESIPTHFIKELMESAECPIVIAPEGFSSVDEIIFAYDGSSSSFFAMKQFTYLFPQLSEVKVSVCPVNAEVNLDAEVSFKHWMESKYTYVDYESIKGKSSDQLFKYLIPKENVLVVMGSYDYSWLSYLFKSNVAKLIIRALNLPLFIAHH